MGPLISPTTVQTAVFKVVHKSRFEIIFFTNYNDNVTGNANDMQIFYYGNIKESPSSMSTEGTTVSRWSIMGKIACSYSVFHKSTGCSNSICAKVNTY